MIEKIEILLLLNTSQARQAWLKEHIPIKNTELIKTLHEEARRRGRDKPQSALPIAELANDVALVWQDQQTHATALHIEADIRRILAEYKTALDLYKQAADLYRQLGLELEAARVAVGQMAAMKNTGLYEEAIALGEWASDMFRETNDQLALGKMTLNLGNTYARLDRYLEARYSYAGARNIFNALKNKRHLAIIDINDATMLTQLNNFLEAEKMLIKARTYFEHENMTSTIAQIDSNLADLYFAQGNYQLSLSTYQKSREIFITQNETIRAAVVDMHRSEIYLVLNLWSEALTLAQSSRSSLDVANMSREIAQLYLIEAAALAHLDDHPSPISALKKAHQLFTQEKNAVQLATTYLYQANIDRRSGNLTSARNHAQDAKQIFEQIKLGNRIAQCEIILGEIALLEKDAQIAAYHFSQALAAMGRSDLPEISYACQFGLGRARQMEGELIATHLHYGQAVLDIERLQASIGAEDHKMAFLSDKLQVYQALILLCLDLGLEEQAIETIERAKSRTLLDAIARETKHNTESPTESNLLIKLENLKGELNWYYNRLNEPLPNNEERLHKQITELTTAINDREQALNLLLNKLRSPDSAEMPKNSIWTVDLSEIQAVLPPETTLLEFYTTHDEIIAFGISNKTLWTERLAVSRNQIADLLGQLRFQMNKFSYGPSYRQRHAATLQQGTDYTLHNLYQILIAPFIKQLTTKTLIIIPHDLLHYVPFHALFDGEQYFIEQKVISYAPSATILHRVLSTKQKITSEPPLILGVPDAGIPYTEQEVKSLSTLFPKANSYLGDKALIKHLDKNNFCPAFLHLSTHATFRADNPLFSALKLADGWLSVNDIYNMTASAPLVTLSACETGRNQVGVGDELIGLSRGFFSAGTKSLIVSLWMVEDSSTAHLMTRFYQNFKAGFSVTDALHAAQMAIKDELKHPYYWAPFMLTGNPFLKIKQISDIF